MAAKIKPTVHFVPQYFLNPVHPIKVTLVGAGGNGSQMLSALCRIDHDHAEHKDPTIICSMGLRHN